SIQVRTRSGRTAGEELLLGATAPLVRLTADIRSLGSGVLEWGSTRRDLLRENSDLKRRLDEASAELLRLRDAERDKTRLLELFGTHPAPPPGTRAGRLIALGEESSGLFRSALLDIG